MLKITSKMSYEFPGQRLQTHQRDPTQERNRQLLNEMDTLYKS